MDTIKGYFNDFSISNSLDEYLFEDQIATEIVVGIVICIIILIMYYLIKGLVSKIKGTSSNTPIIYKGLKPADVPVIVRQDPNLKNSITLPRSLNEKTGIEYSYVVWLWLDPKSWTNNRNWKHVFHKGQELDTTKLDKKPSDICEIQCPGLWIGEESNNIRLYVNTFGTNDEYIEMDNLPLKKWICLIYTQSNFSADVYINGRLKERKELRTLPRQNYSDVYINQNDGFEGYISQLCYYNYSLNAGDIHDITEQGPNLKLSKQESDTASSVKIDNEIPYLSNRWWTNDLTTDI